MAVKKTEGRKEIGDKLGRKQLLLLFLIVAAAFLIRVYFLTRQPLIYEPDGPYYLINTDGLLKGQFLPFESIIFYYFAPFAIAFGDLTFGIKVAASLLSALTIVPIFFTARRLTRDNRTAFFAAILACFSLSAMFELSNTLKEVGGMLILTTLVYFLLPHIQDSQDKSKEAKSARKMTTNEILTILVLLLLLMLTHITSTLYFLSFALPFFVYLNARGANGLRGNDAMNLLIVMLVSFFIFLLLYQLVGGYNIMAWASGFLDLSHSSFYLNLQMFLWYLPILPFVLVGAYQCLKGRAEGSSFLILWLAMGLVVAQPFYNDDFISHRFGVMIYPLMIFIASIGLSALLKQGEWTWRGIAWKGVALSAILLSATFMLAASSGFGPVITEEEYSFLSGMRSSLPADTVIIKSYKGYYNAPVGWWLRWIGFSLKPEGELTAGDRPFILLESPNNSTEAKALEVLMTSEDVVGEYGRFRIVAYPPGPGQRLDS